MSSKKIGLATLHILLVLYLWIQYINIKLLIYIIGMASYIQIFFLLFSCIIESLYCFILKIVLF